MLQLRTAQTDAANAQAAQAVAEAKPRNSTTKITELEKRQSRPRQAERNADKAASEETIAKLNNKLAERESASSEFTEAREKWKAGYQKAAAVARTKEEERAKLAAEVLVNKRTIADRQTKNISLFNTSNEILDRYENYALGKALGAREPFIGTTRVKIENLVQGYKDKILDNRISACKPQAMIGPIVNYLFCHHDPPHHPTPSRGDRPPCSARSARSRSPAWRSARIHRRP